MNKLNLTALIVVLATLTMGCDTPDSANDVQTVTHTVTFNSNGGSAVESQDVVEGGKVAEPSAPTRSDHIFEGWYSDEALTQPWNFAGNTVNGTLTLYARWVSGTTHTVTFNSNGGSAVESQYVPEDGLITEPDAPTRSGFTFNGWYSDEALTQPWNFVGNSVNGSLTLYAGWVLGTTNTVTFNSNGGSAVESQDVTEGGKVTEPDAPTRSGFTFNGWYSDEALTQPWNFAGNTVNNALTLYAGWVSGTTHTVTFNSNGGSAVESQDVTEGDKVAEPDAPTRSGYIFNGWYSDEALTQPWNFAGNSVNSALTLYAGWVNAYTVTYDLNGASGTAPTAAKVKEDETIATAPILPTRKDYTHTGWYDNYTGGTKFNFGAAAGTAVTADITLYARWSITQQTTTFNIGDDGPAGGKVFYDKGSYSDGWRYMEAPTSDTSSLIQWGGEGNIGTLFDIGTGKTNTKAIVSKLADTDYAAKLCYDLIQGGYDDWFLPSKDELNELHKNKDSVGNFTIFSYWTSSEVNSLNAWTQNISTGKQGGLLRSLKTPFRAVRAF